MQQTQQNDPPNEQKYFRDDGTLDPDLLETRAEQVAQSLRIKPTQLRRFYDDVLRIRQRLETASGTDATQREQTFEHLRAEFKMLKAKAAYAHGRDERMFPEELLQFFIDHTASVKTAKDFDAFCRHFQAVVAFHRFYNPKD